MLLLLEQLLQVAAGVLGLVQPLLVLEPLVLELLVRRKERSCNAAYWVSCGRHRHP
jgi:hypothetical protein